MDQQFYESWKQYVHNLDEVLEQLNKQLVIAVGVAPYQRIVPSLFFDKESYQIFSVQKSADVEVLRNYANIYCFEEEYPEDAAKVQATIYLLKNYQFHKYLKSHKRPVSLLFYQTNPPIVDYLDKAKIPWIGNHPDIFDPILHKEGFRERLQELGITHLPNTTYSVPQFLNIKFDNLIKRWEGSVVCQPGDYEMSGGTMFIHNQEDLTRAQESFFENERLNNVNTIKVSPFIKGEALSMLGCVTKKGTLTGPLQLQLVDVPESLYGYPPGGTFFGHDWGFKAWDESVEKKAQDIVEKLGTWLATRGYKGIFGIDFMLEEGTNELYPLECNPRFTGTIPVFSFLNLLSGAPPIDFFTLVDFMNIKIDFDFDAVNTAWKKKIDAAHIAITPKGLETMNLNMPAGIYTYTASSRSLQYLRPGAFLHELKNEDEFILIDQVPMQNRPVMQNVPRLFKLVFPKSIALGTKQVKPEIGDILTGISAMLRS
jgi:hypothetical protein